MKVTNVMIIVARYIGLFLSAYYLIGEAFWGEVVLSSYLLALSYFSLSVFSDDFIQNKTVRGVLIVAATPGIITEASLYYSTFMQLLAVSNLHWMIIEAVPLMVLLLLMYRNLRGYKAGTLVPYIDRLF